MYMNMDSYKCLLPSSSKSKQIASLSKVLKLVSEESRLKLLCLLYEGSFCVCELMEFTGMSQSLISHHLSDLKEEEIVIDDKQGLKVYYSITEKGKRIIDPIFGILKRGGGL